MRLHRHRWRVRATKPWQSMWYDHEGRQMTRQETQVLQVCARCQAIRTQRITGTWTLGEVDPRTASERLVEELEANGS